MNFRLAVLTALATWASHAATPDADFATLREQVAALGKLTSPPAVYSVDGTTSSGAIKPLFFEGLPWKGKPTRVYAWLGLPEKPGGGKVPGVVLVHGGGGTAFKEWVEKWNAQGFAAISLAVEGQTDERIPGAPPGAQWQRHAHGGPARQGIYGDSAEPLADQWMYHAVADVILAHSLLRSLPAVDAARVGVCGISWGGIITSTVVGIDARFAFGIPIYGCGALDRAPNQYGRALSDLARYREVWEPLLRLPRATLPLLWLTGPRDAHFPLELQQASYRAAAGPRMVSVPFDMKHSHPAGWLPPDSYAFAKAVVETGRPWARELTSEIRNGTARVEFDATRSVQSATLVFKRATAWEQAPATLETAPGRATASAALPAGATAWFFNLAAGELTLSSELHVVAHAPKPNIVYVLADDLGYGDVQVLNPARGKIKTPHLDRLAAQGMSFTDAHSGSSVCTPTRYGLLTGRYAWRSRLQKGVLDGTDDPPLIAAERLTVPALLKQHGYTTAIIGKWHLGFLSERPADPNPTEPARTSTEKKTQMGLAGLPVGSRIIGGPITRGFDYFWGCSNARTMSGLIENDRVIENLPPIQMLPRLEGQAVRYIGEHAAAAKSGRPFFLYVALTSPHTPILPTVEWQGRSGLGAYGDFVMQTDAVVGSILGALDAHGLAENTLVIFTSDNGCSPQAGTPALEKQGHFASAQFRGYKADIWDGGHRVPFFARWPGRIKSAATSAQLICHVDLMATCAELLGGSLPATAGEDSVSILPALLGTDRAPLHPAVVHHSINGSFSIRQGDWKLELCPDSGGWSAPTPGSAAAKGLPETQLYNLRTDPAEANNLQAERPDEVARLTRLLERYVADGRSTPGAPQPNDVAIQLRKVTAKGARK